MFKTVFYTMKPEQLSTVMHETMANMSRALSSAQRPESELHEGFLPFLY